ncbi:unnamed protein product [Umbelopsis sp. WA50703]
MSTKKVNDQETSSNQRSADTSGPGTGKPSFFRSSGRLLSSLPTKQFLGNMSTSVNTLSQTLQQRATELPSSWSSIQAKLQHLPMDIAHLPQNFESAREQFVNSKLSTEKQARKGSG